VKNNLGPIATPIGFSLSDGRFTWTGASDLTAARILAADQSEDTASALAEAVEFLCLALHDGPRSARAVQDDAKEIGIAVKSTLRRAKQHLGVRVSPVKDDTGRVTDWQWSLPGDHDRPDDHDDHRGIDDHLDAAAEVYEV
jgi:hypothetical protein